MKARKIHMRMCNGCGEMKSKKELVRVVKGPDESISLDLTGKKAGRGAYICKNVECLKKARKTKRMEKSLDCQIPDEVYDNIEKEISANG